MFVFTKCSGRAVQRYVSELASAKIERDELVVVVIPEKKQALQIEHGVCRSHVIIWKKGTGSLGLGLDAGAESARNYRVKIGAPSLLHCVFVLS